MNSLKKPSLHTLLIWAARIIAAVILLQTLFFKFSAAPESVYIFSKLGVEPWGRIGSGVVELIAAGLILIPQATWLGALLGLGVMTGAIAAHLFILGIPVMGDSGQLFIYACIVWLCCAWLVWLNRHKIPVLKNVFH